MGPTRVRRAFRQHLATDLLLGVDRVPIGVVSPPAQEAPSPSQPMARPMRDDAADAGPPPQRAAPEARVVIASAPGIAGADRQRKLQLLETIDASEVRGCTKCGLCDSRTQTVFGEGDPDAALMFIGEGPGVQEDRLGRPFVGPAGDMLNKQIAAMGLEREQVYIANVVKCRPPNNRAPTPQEAQTCGAYLYRQVQIISPKVIVALGGPATKLLLNTVKGITSIRGTWHSFDQIPGMTPIPVMPTFHPAYLLRAYTPDTRKKVWSDLQKAMQRLGE